MGVRPLSTSAQIPRFVVGETRLCEFAFDDALDDGAVLSGTPAVVELTSSDLTIASVSRNSAAITVLGSSRAINTCVTCIVSGHLAATGSYTLKCTVTTDAGETLVRTFSFVVEAAS